MSKVNFKELKASKKAKSKALKGGIVLKKDCPVSGDDCTKDCKENICRYEG